MNVRRGGGESGGYGTTKMAGAMMARETYNAPHRVPWHWPVPAYLVTKAISAGTFMVAGTGVSLGWLPSTPLFTTWASFISLLFALITTVLLIADLSQPKRFYYMLIKPQWKSWLTKGAFVLIGFTTLVGVSWLAYLLGYPAIANALIWPGVVLAVLTAIYTAFLFAQCEGRDLWQSKWLAPHLFVQAVMAGAATLLILGAFAGIGADAMRALAMCVGVSSVANLVMMLSEAVSAHRTDAAAAAARLVSWGHYRNWFLLAAVCSLAPIAAAPYILAFGSDVHASAEVSISAIAPFAGLICLLGLYAYEWAFVMAPQEVPNN